MKKITTTSTQVNRTLSFLVHGASGSGKTRLIRTLADGGHTPLILSAEKGLASLGSGSPIAVYEVDTFADVGEAYRFLYSSKEAEKYDWVCLDSVTECLQMLLVDELEGGADGRQAYGEVGEKGMKMVRLFRDLKKHTLFISQQAAGDVDDGVSLRCASAPGKRLVRDLPYQFDEVFALLSWREKGKVKQAIQTGRDAKYDAKDRTGALDFLEKPDLSYIQKKIEDYMGKRGA